MRYRERRRDQEKDGEGQRLDTEGDVDREMGTDGRGGESQSQHMKEAPIFTRLVPNTCLY